MEAKSQLSCWKEEAHFQGQDTSLSLSPRQEAKSGHRPLERRSTGKGIGLNAAGARHATSEQQAPLPAEGHFTVSNNCKYLRHLNITFGNRQ